MDAARQEFADRGFRDATVRSIAERAGVNSALVHHFFGSKSDLFRASIESALKPEQMSDVVEPGTDGLGERLVLLFFNLWDSETTQGPMLAVIRSALTHEEAANLLREFVGTRLLGQVARAIHLADADVRSELIGSQLIGVAFLRYVLRMEPLASAGVDTLAAWLGPTVQRYLTGEVPVHPAGRSGRGASDTARTTSRRPRPDRTAGS